MHRYTSPFTWRTNPYAPFSFFAEDVVETVGPRMHTNLPVVWKPCGLAVHSVAKRNSCAAVATNLALPIAWKYPMMSAIDFSTTHGSCTYSMSIGPTFASFLKTRAFEE